MRLLPIAIAAAISALVPDLCVAQKVVTVDVKTRMADKADLSALKAGVLHLIRASDWIANRESGEDYSLWLGGLSRRRVGDTVAVTLTVELRTPAAFRSGETLDSRTIHVTYSVSDDWTGVRSVRDAVERQLNNRGQQAVAEALFVGEQVMQATREMITSR
jgi:hypothetical protein